MKSLPNLLFGHVPAGKLLTDERFRRCILDTTRKAKVNNVTITGFDLDEAARAAELIRQEGLGVIHTSRPGHELSAQRPSIAPWSFTPKNIEKWLTHAHPGVLHTNRNLDNPLSAFDFCPNYRGELFWLMLSRLQAISEKVRPDVMLFDTETWKEAANTEHNWPGMIEGCGRCGTGTGHDNALREIAEQIQRAVGYGSHAKCIFWYNAARNIAYEGKSFRRWLGVPGCPPFHRDYHCWKDDDPIDRLADLTSRFDLGSGYVALCPLVDYKDRSRGIVDKLKWLEAVWFLASRGIRVGMWWPHKLKYDMDFWSKAGELAGLAVRASEHAGQ